MTILCILIGGISALVGMIAAEALSKNPYLGGAIGLIVAILVLVVISI